MIEDMPDLPKRRALAVSVIFAVILITACDNGAPSRTDVEDTAATPCSGSMSAGQIESCRYRTLTATSFEFEPGELVFSAIGMTETLVAFGYNEFGDELAPDDWTSANPSVAFVDAAGRVTSIGPGSTVILAWTYGTPFSLRVVVQDQLRHGPAFSAQLVSTGVRHSCAIDTSGTAWCWGNNDDGRLGTGDDDHSDIARATATPLAFSNISAGDRHSCALTGIGDAWCWGSNARGQLGTRSVDAIGSTVPVKVDSNTQFTQIAAGDGHTCALDASGAAWCWGEVGEHHSNVVRSDTPMRVAGDHVFSRLAAAGDFACGLEQAGAAWCWGSIPGALSGTESEPHQHTVSPTRIAPEHVFVDFAASASYACGLKADGTVWCWGSNGAGELGDGTTTARATPHPISANQSFTSITTGSSHSCALAADGTAWCWGGNYRGELGRGDTSRAWMRDVDGTVPAPVLGGLIFDSIVAGSEHTCGVTLSSELRCWGSAASGATGTGLSGHDQFEVVPWPVTPPWQAAVGEAADLQRSSGNAGSFSAAC